MSTIYSVSAIQQLLEQWRELGHEQHKDGVEQIGWTGESWLHTLLPGASAMSIAGVEHELGAALPSRLKAIYRCIGGLRLFDGMFELHAISPRVRRRDTAHGISSLVVFNEQVDKLGWKPPGAVAFATNAWDQSIHLTGLGRTTSEIVRCEPGTGRIIERHHDALSFLEARLSRLDGLTVN